MFENPTKIPVPFDFPDGVIDAILGVRLEAVDYGQELEQHYGNSNGRDVPEGPPVENAARHGYWIAEITRLHGAGVAQAVGDAHEAGQGGDPDSERDRANNAVAIEIGKQSLCESDTRRLLEQALRDGKFFDENLNDPRHPLNFRPPGELPKPVYSK